MKEEKKTILLAAGYGTKEIVDLCTEMTFNLSRLLEFVEEERCKKIIEELAEKSSEIAKRCVAVGAICKAVADGGSDYKSIEKIVDEILNEKEGTSDN